MKKIVKLVTILVVMSLMLMGCDEVIEILDEIGTGYSFTVIDETGKGVPGVSIQVCTDKTCQLFETDVDGFAYADIEPAVYEVHIQSYPEGYYCDPDNIYVTKGEYEDISFTLTKAGGDTATDSDAAGIEVASEADTEESNAQDVINDADAKSTDGQEAANDVDAKSTDGQEAVNDADAKSTDGKEAANDVDAENTDAQQGVSEASAGSVNEQNVKEENKAANSGILAGYIPYAIKTYNVTPSNYKVSFSGTDIYGNVINDSIFASYDVTLVNMWEPWCGPCINEMPEFQKAVSDLQKLGIRFNIIGFYQTEENARNRVAEMGITYPIVKNTGFLNEFATGYVPTNFFVNSAGYVLPITVDEMKQILLAEYVTYTYGNVDAASFSKYLAVAQADTEISSMASSAAKSYVSSKGQTSSLSYENLMQLLANRL